ncbi:MAG: hypothetical protein K8R38_04860 [Verrucomicrobia bacterium]|nr:hypothetical protein [Verrucomicrobiota bacterium]
MSSFQCDCLSFWPAHWVVPHDCHRPPGFRIDDSFCVAQPSTHRKG